MKKLIIILLVLLTSGCAYYPNGVMGLQTSTGLCTYPVQTQDGNLIYIYVAC